MGQAIGGLGTQEVADHDANAAIAEGALKRGILLAGGVILTSIPKPH